MALQGFPIAVIDDMAGTLRDDLKEPLLTDLAGNMVSVPVMLAIAMSTFASVSWAPVETEDKQKDPSPSPDASDAADGIDGKALSENGDPDAIGVCESNTDAGASIDAGLMSGPPGLADETGKKRKRGLLRDVFGKVRNVATDM